jgi:hypothetical protein
MAENPEFDWFDDVPSYKPAYTIGGFSACHV